MAINTAGVANPQKQLLLGRGVIMVAPLDADGNPTAFRDLCNAPDFSVSGTHEEVTHTSSRHALAVIDKRVPTSQGFSISFTLDEVLDFGNSADWYNGDAAAETNGAVAGFTVWQVVPDGTGSLAGYLGRHIIVRSSAGVRAFDFDSGDLDVITTETVPVTLTPGTDYEVDTVNGSIFLIADSAHLATAAAAGKGITLTLAANVGAPATVDVVRGLKHATKVVALRFISENAADGGVQNELMFPRVQLSSDGDQAYIGKDFATMKFVGAIEAGDIGSIFEGEYVIISGANGS